jgi:hypothetical protein
MPTEKVMDGGTTEMMPKEPKPDIPAGNAPQVGDLVINEVIPDPGTIDINSDGTSSSTGDEFIEIVNVSSKTLQVGGLQIYLDTNTSKRITLQSLALPPKGVIIIFGGGMQSDMEANTGKPHSKFNGAYVYTGTSILTNTSTRKVILEDAQKTQISSFTYGVTGCKPSKGVSLTLSPDLTGACVLHSTAQANVPYSPGTKIDGTKF